MQSKNKQLLNYFLTRSTADFNTIQQLDISPAAICEVKDEFWWAFLQRLQRTPTHALWRVPHPSGLVAGLNGWEVAALAAAQLLPVILEVEDCNLQSLLVNNCVRIAKHFYACLFTIYDFIYDGKQVLKKNKEMFRLFKYFPKLLWKIQFPSIWLMQYFCRIPSTRHG